MCRVHLPGCSGGLHTDSIAAVDTAPTTPQVTTPQALLVKEESARIALLLVFPPTSSALSMC